VRESGKTHRRGSRFLGSGTDVERTSARAKVTASSGVLRSLENVEGRYGYAAERTPVSVGSAVIRRRVLSGMNPGSARQNLFIGKIVTTFGTNDHLGESVRISWTIGRDADVASRDFLRDNARSPSCSFAGAFRFTRVHLSRLERTKGSARLIIGKLQPLRVAAQLSSTGRDPQPYIRGLRRDLTSTHPTLGELRHHPLYSENCDRILRIGLSFR